MGNASRLQHFRSGNARASNSHDPFKVVQFFGPSLVLVGRDQPIEHTACFAESIQ